MNAAILRQLLLTLLLFVVVETTAIFVYFNVDVNLQVTQTFYRPKVDYSSGFDISLSSGRLYAQDSQ